MKLKKNYSLVLSGGDAGYCDKAVNIELSFAVQRWPQEKSEVPPFEMYVDNIKQHSRDLEFWLELIERIENKE